jgi:nicotinate phosphoribosyltransferase
MPWVNDDNASLLTDLYELTMAASYFAHAMNEPATFELFVRALPSERRFLISAGLEDALHYLEQLHFAPEELAFLESTQYFERPFLDYLREFRFSGEVWAMAEGEAVFSDEPMLRITAPLIEAQVVETFLLNVVNFQTLIASKAARIAIACGDREFVDFSPRRDHGADAALKAARAAYIGGASATSNVLAGSAYGIPLSGTMAHSYVMSFECESDAFRTFARDFPDRSILLIDTYDTLEGARAVVKVAAELAGEGVRIVGVRLDSGDLATLSIAVREILDGGGCAETKIFASGDLDEHRIAALLAAGAPIDAFGVGTQLGTSADAPALSGVYKLVEDSEGLKSKLSAEKFTWPGRKQLYRFSYKGRYLHDTVALEEEVVPGGGALLRKVMLDGHALSPSESLTTIRARCRETLAALPDELQSLDGEGLYAVQRTDALEAARRTAIERVREGGSGAAFNPGA